MLLPKAAQQFVRKSLPTWTALPMRWIELKWKPLLQGLTIVLTGLWIYWPVLHGGWLWDDVFYYLKNPLLKDPSRILKAWFEPGSFIEYYPVHETLQWIQWKSWGQNTLGYHLTNILLHIFSGLLLWQLLGRFHLKLAWIGGLIFVSHPMQVESVAWLSEFKNTLCLPPFLIAVSFYLKYDQTKNERSYWLSFLFFCVAMLCKIAVAPFPLFIIVYKWIEKGKPSGKDVFLSAPFFAISILLGSISLWSGIHFAEAKGLSVDNGPTESFLKRFVLTNDCTLIYIGHFLDPYGLLPLYPQWRVNVLSLYQLGPCLAIFATIVLLSIAAKTWRKGVLPGLAFFILFVCPFSGIVPASYMRLTWLMDHLTYISIVGLIGVTVVFLELIYTRVGSRWRAIYCLLCAAVLSNLAWNSHCYAKVFSSEEVLWSYVVARVPDSAIAHDNLGYAWMSSGEMGKAISEYRRSLELAPNAWLTHEHLGCALIDSGNPSMLAEAENQFQIELQLHASDPVAYNDLGNAEIKSNDGLLKAIASYETAIRLKPNFAEAHLNLANAWMKLSGRQLEVIEELELAVGDDPNLTAAQSMLGVLLAAIPGREADAVLHFESALRSDPTDANDEYNLAFLFAHMDGHSTDAIDHFVAYLKLRPNDAIAHYNLGAVLLSTTTSTVPEAETQLRLALQLHPGFERAQKLLNQLTLQSQPKQ